MPLSRSPGSVPLSASEPSQRLDRFRVALDEFAAGSYALNRQRGAFGVVGRKFAAIEGGPGKLPGDNVIGGLGLVKFLGRDKNFLGAGEQPNALGGVGICNRVADRD